MIPTAERLVPRAEVHIPDFPGFGDSDKPEEILDVPGLADALAAWLRTVLGRPAALVGNSFACQIIIDMAARYPDLLTAAVLQGPTTRRRNEPGSISSSVGGRTRSTTRPRPARSHRRITRSAATFAR
jgi:pimeloyl-ACP methyl ester carboxylesterase